MASDERSTAIEVVGAHRYYGSLHVLKDLEMNVPYGSIYGLLGSSGCGKTTLLRCILGRLQLAEGHISVLGKPPGSKGHHIPGKDVGYMPQELALFGDFTMLETMYYFGILHGLSISKIKERGQFLLELLELPSVNKRISKLSGGQQRRVSFAVAMLQEPPLLILDEPTVGVDPLLRAKIWQHLLDLVKTNGTTIIITTHYIEEARQANLVGLMRDGRLLAEAPPQQLMRTYNMNTLEEVFLSLCKDQDANRETPSAITAATGRSRIAVDPINETTPLVNREEERSIELVKNKKEQVCNRIMRTIKEGARCGPCNPATAFPRPRNVLALVWKNAMRILRNPGLLLFQFILPTFQICLFCWAIGRNLKGVNVAVVNSDVGLPQNYCGIDNFGSLFVSTLNTDTVNIKHFHSISRAVQQVKDGKAWAAIDIPTNFSGDLLERAILMKEHKPVPLNIVNGSTIEIYEDITNLQLTYTLQQVLVDSIELSLNDFLEGCNIPNVSVEFSSPLKFHQPPVYGRTHQSYTDYVTPGMITGIMFGFSIGLTAISLVVEGKEGLIDRTWVAGVNVTEIIIGQILTQFFIVLIQISLLVTVVVFGFKVYMVHKWSLVLVGALAMFQGLTGMSYGLFISSLCHEEVSALQLMAGSFYPVLLLSGVIWPVLGMPKVLQYISMVLPTTYAAEAMRSIMERGWSLDRMDVLNGFIVSFVWFMLFVFLSMIGLKLKK